MLRERLARHDRPMANPGPYRRASSRQIASAFRRLAVLMRRDAEEEARLRVPRILRDRAIERGLRLLRDDAVRRRDQGLAELGFEIGLRRSSPLMRSALRRAFTASSKRPSRT